MSVDYYFNINIIQRGISKFTAKDVIKCYLNAGWTLYSERNQVIYTGIGDSEEFDFLADFISETEFFDIVQRKEQNEEIIAFALFRIEENCRYRIDVMIASELEILISPDDATKKLLIPDLKVLDVNWYLCRILPPLINDNILVESFSYAQI